MWTDQSNRLESSAVGLGQRIMIGGGAQWTVPSGLMLFNEVIIRKGCRAGASLIDFRLICDVAADDAKSIEPSVVGEHEFGAGARAIHRALDAMKDNGCKKAAYGEYIPGQLWIM